MNVDPTGLSKYKAQLLEKQNGEWVVTDEHDLCPACDVGSGIMAGLASAGYDTAEFLAYLASETYGTATNPYHGSYTPKLNQYEDYRNSADGWP